MPKKFYDFIEYFVKKLYSLSNKYFRTYLTNN